MRVAPTIAAASATRIRPVAIVASVLLVAGLAVGPSTTFAAAAPPAANAGCSDLQARIDEIMVPLADRVGEADVLDVVLHVEDGRVARVEARGAQPAYERGLRRALRELACGARSESGERRLRVLVVDRWRHLPAGIGPDGRSLVDIPG